jgi:hypothetical protein
MDVQHDGRKATRACPPRLTLVPNESVPSAAEDQSEAKAVRRLLLAVAAEQVSEEAAGYSV